MSKPNEKIDNNNTKSKKRSTTSTTSTSTSTAIPHQSDNKNTLASPTTSTSTSTDAKKQKQESKATQQHTNLDRPFIQKEDKKLIIELTSKIENGTQTISRINTLIEEVKQKREQLQLEEMKARKDVQQLSATINSKEEKIKQIEDQIVQEEKLKKIQTDELNNFKQQVEVKWSMQFKSHGLDSTNKGSNLAKIDNRIKTLETKISSTSMPLMEEKKLVADVNSLQQLKGIVKDYHKRSKDISEARGRTFLEQKIVKLQEKLNKDREDEAAALSTLLTIQKNIQTLNDEIEAQLATRKSTKSQIALFTADLNATRDKIHVQKEQWQKEREEKRKQQQEAWETQQRAKTEARVKRNSDRLVKESTHKPFEEDITVCDKLTKKLTELIKTTTEGTKFDLLQHLDIIIMFEQLSLSLPATLEQCHKVQVNIQTKKNNLLAKQAQIPWNQNEESIAINKES